MPTIFLSHSSRAEQWCEWLAREARVLGIDTYLAEHDVRPGAVLAEKVKQAIRRCDAVVVLLTDNSAASPYVHQEVGFALAQEKLVIPLVQPGVRAEGLAMLQGVEYIPFDFEEPLAAKRGFAMALNRLAEQAAQAGTGHLGDPRVRRVDSSRADTRRFPIRLTGGQTRGRLRIELGSLWPPGWEAQARDTM